MHVSSGVYVRLSYLTLLLAFAERPLTNLSYKMKFEELALGTKGQTATHHTHTHTAPTCAIGAGRRHAGTTVNTHGCYKFHHHCCFYHCPYCCYQHCFHDRLWVHAKAVPRSPISDTRLPRRGRGGPRLADPCRHGGSRRLRGRSSGDCLLCSSLSPFVTNGDGTVVVIRIHARSVVRRGAAGYSTFGRVAARGQTTLSVSARGRREGGGRGLLRINGFFNI